jgi:ATPase subunit of ABC transporter with duplicated ATPase domains
VARGRAARGRRARRGRAAPRATRRRRLARTVDPLPRRHLGQLRRLQGAEQAVAAIDAGELRCIIGPNGAGKTTMMDVITGKTRPDAGTAFFGQTIDLTR